MNCPICKIRLLAVQYEGISILECEACSGYWLSSEALREVVDRRIISFSVTHSRSLAKRLRNSEIPIREFERDLSCPECLQSLSTINFGLDSGLIVNRCHNGHGIWLDRLELETLQMLIEGLELL
jgi:Zn-finger nucleic acid-binding protein